MTDTGCKIVNELIAVKKKAKERKGEIETLRYDNRNLRKALQEAIEQQPPKPIVWVRYSHYTDGGNRTQYYAPCDSNGEETYSLFPALQLQVWEHIYRDLATVRVWEEPKPDPVAKVTSIDYTCPKCAANIKVPIWEPKDDK